ncbi:MAG: DNA polymerase III subunit beta, partial [Muribaculaceae bacterium]|nr:DNA polymerase III subunit beta [Muribaculaceae bacterium]
MKFNIDGKVFQQQLQAVNKVINSKNALSILDNFLFELEGGWLTVTGSDQENIVSSRVEVT